MPTFFLQIFKIVAYNTLITLLSNMVLLINHDFTGWLFGKQLKQINNLKDSGGESKAIKELGIMISATHSAFISYSNLVIS